MVNIGEMYEQICNNLKDVSDPKRSVERGEILENNGFSDFPERELYYKITSKQVVSYKFIHTANDDEFKNIVNEWRFYFSKKLSLDRVRNIIEIITKTDDT